MPIGHHLGFGLPPSLDPDGGIPVDFRPEPRLTRPAGPRWHGRLTSLLACPTHAIHLQPAVIEGHLLPRSCHHTPGVDHILRSEDHHVTDSHLRRLPHQQHIPSEHRRLHAGVGHSDCFDEKHPCAQRHHSREQHHHSTCPRRPVPRGSARGGLAHDPSPTFSTARKASCGISTEPTDFIRRLPFFCFSRSLRLRLMSPP